MTAPDLRKQVIDVIPMAFLISNDVPGATGPTPQCDVVQAVRDLTAAGRSAVNRCLAVEAMRDVLLKALEALAPYLDAIVCYASTMDEHEPNRIAAEARAAIAKARGEAA